MKSENRFLCVATVLAIWAVPAFAQSNDLDQAANDLLAAGYPTPAASLFQSNLARKRPGENEMTAGGDYVRLWHKADIQFVPTNVCFRG